MNHSFDYYQYKSTCFLAFQGDLEFFPNESQIVSFEPWSTEVTF